MASEKLKNLKGKLTSAGSKMKESVKKTSAYITPKEKKKIFPRGWALKRRQDWPISRARKMFERAEKERKEHYPGLKPTPELKKKLRKEREEEIYGKDEGGLLGSFTHTVTGWWGKKKEEQKEVAKTLAPIAITAATGGAAAPAAAGAAVEAAKATAEAKEKEKEAAEAKKKAAKEEEEAAEEEKDTTDDKKKSWKEKYEEMYYRKKWEEEFGEEEEKAKEKGIGSKLFGALKRGAKKTGKAGLGARKETTKKTLFGAFQLLLTAPIMTFMLFSVAIPEVEGWTGKPLIPRQFAWLQQRTSDVLMLIVVFTVGVLLIPALIMGSRGVDLSIPNGLILTVIAFSAGIWLFNHIFMDYVKAYHTEEYEMMMCLIKYGGNMQICALGEEEIQYKKEGTYETLKSEMGVVTPDRTIPPMRPNPDSDETYEFMFTLKNENEVGSLYDIRVSSIVVRASSDDDSIDPMLQSRFFYEPPYNIKPGEYRVVQTEFDNLPMTDKYMYFQINVTSEQHGGGSAKYGIVSSTKGNENFAYFFDPEIITNPGPLDVYLYTYPFVLGVKELREKANNPRQFKLYIVIVNKGDGIAKMDNVTLIHTSELDPAVIEKITCYGTDYTPSNGVIKIPLCTNGDCVNDAWEVPLEKEGDEEEDRILIKCTGEIKNQSFIGKATDFISVIVDYEFKQTWDEQIARGGKGNIPTGESGGCHTPDNACLLTDGATTSNRSLDPEGSGTGRERDYWKFEIESDSYLKVTMTPSSDGDYDIHGPYRPGMCPSGDMIGDPCDQKGVGETETCIPKNPDGTTKILEEEGYWCILIINKKDTKEGTYSLTLDIDSRGVSSENAAPIACGEKLEEEPIPEYRDYICYKYTIPPGNKQHVTIKLEDEEEVDSDYDIYANFEGLDAVGCPSGDASDYCDFSTGDTCDSSGDDADGLDPGSTYYFKVQHMGDGAHLDYDVSLECVDA